MNQLWRGEARSAGFFAAYESNANTCNLNAMAAQFAATFLAGGVEGSTMVRREDFLAFLPKRYQMLQALGGGDAALTALEEIELDSTYLLARTAWEVEAAGGDAGGPGITVRSTFLLEKRGENWQIVAYLAHDDLLGLLKKRQAIA